MKSLARFFSPASFGCIAVLAAFMIPGCPPVNPTTVQLELRSTALQVTNNRTFDEDFGQWEQGSTGVGGFRVPEEGGMPSESPFEYNVEISFGFEPTTAPGQSFEETAYELEFSHPGVSVIYQEFYLRRPEGPDGIVLGRDNLIRSRFRDLDGVIGPAVFAYLRIDPSVPARPVFVSLRGTTGDRITAYTARLPFYIRRDGPGPAPRITDVAAPAQLLRGTRVPIAVTGLDFDGTAQIVMEDAAGIGVQEQSFDAGTGTLSAVLDVGREAETGYSFFHIETAAGGSEDGSVFIKAPRPVDVRAVYPNYGVLGSPVEVTLSGEGFHEGMQVVSVPLAAIDTNPVTFFGDTQAVRTRVTPQTADLAARLDAQGIGGMDSEAFPIHPRGFRGPRIARVTPRQIVEGTRDVQIEIEGVNFDTHAPTGFEALLSDVVGDLFRPGDGRRILSRPAPPSPRVVLLAQPDAMARRGPFDLAIRTAGGLTTNVAPMELIAPPRDKPFAAHAQTGRIARDGMVRPDTILGERLTGVRRVTSNTPGLEVVSFTENPSGTSLGVMVRASAAAPLTGDTRTVFKVHTAEGESNEVGYLVEPAGASPGAPRLDRIFPNFVYPANNAQTFFDVTGAGFANLWELLVTPPGSTNPDIFNFAENSSRGNALLISLEVYSPATTNALGITVTTQGGALVSNPLSIAVLDPANPTGPAILSVSPSTIDVQPDSVFQFRISGTNFGPAGSASLIRFARDNDDPIRSVRLFSPTDPVAAQSSVVVQFDIGPARDGDVTEFALEANGLVSALAAISFSATPEGSEGQPFLSRTTGGQIRRGQTVMNETIRGTGLLNVTSVVFNAPGITVSNIVQSTDGGASFTANFTAAGEAVLTGDTVTSFYIETADGGRSNNSGYIVLP